MSIKIVVVFLLFIVALGLISGPGFRKFLYKVLGISRRGR